MFTFTKLFLFALFTSIGFYSFCQLTIEQPQIYYVSSRQYENSDWMKVGEKILFRQECTTDIPPEIPTGIVFFENVYIKKERFSMAYEFKDTVIVSVTYYLEAKQSELLKQIGYAELKVNGSAIKGQWTYIGSTEKMNTVIVGDKKRIVVVQTKKENSTF